MLKEIFHLEVKKTGFIFFKCSLMSQLIMKLFLQIWQYQIYQYNYLCEMQCIVKYVENISWTNENIKTIAMKYVLLTGILTSLLVSISQVFPAMYKRLHKQHTKKVQTPAFILAPDHPLISSSPHHTMDHTLEGQEEGGRGST